MHMSVRATVDKFFRNFEKPFKPLNTVELSRSAFLHNFDFFQEQSPGHVLPVLKANAYGHGLEEITKILWDREFPYIAVDGYFEALKIHDVSPNQPVLVMGAIDPENYKFMKFTNMAFVVQTKAAIEALAERRIPIKVHLEINTGMNRHGIEPEELEEYLNLLNKHSNIELEGVMTHLASADVPHDRTAAEQAKVFDECVEQILETGIKPALIHIGQSAGSLRIKSKHANAIRPGFGLYGVNPFEPEDSHFKDLENLRPALRLVSKIGKVREIKKGEKVSYGGTFTAKYAMRIGVLPLGYYEGMPRALSNKGKVLFGKHKLPIVGRVCMNHTMIELSGTDLVEGDEVVVISDNTTDPNSFWNIDRHTGVYRYTLMTSINSNLHRKIVD